MNTHVSPAAVAVIGSNSDDAIKTLNETLRELGRDSVASALAKPKMAIAICRAAADGLIGEDDAQATYDQYLAGRTYVKQRNVMATADEDKGSEKANVSKNRQIIRLGALPKVDGPALLDRVTDRRKAAFDGDLKVKPTFDCFVDAARAQLEKPAEELTDDEIDAIVTKGEPADKSELDKMVDEYKRLYRLTNGTKNEPGIPAVEPAMRAMGDAIVGMGGEIPPMTKEEKKEAEAIAFLKANPHLAASKLIPAQPAE